MSINIPLRLPEFHGDPENHPRESWKQYKFNLELAYKVSGIKKIDDDQKAAHLLQGLQGQARTFLELNPDLKDKPLKEVEKILETQFGNSRAVGLPDLSAIIQKPSEQVSEFATRLKIAAAPMVDEKRDIQIMTENEIKEKGINRDFVKVWTPEEYAKERAIIKEAADRFILPYFIKGLKSKIRTTVMQKQPETLEKAIQIASENERYMQTYGNLSMAEISLADADPIVQEAASHLQALNQNHQNKKQDTRKYQKALPVNPAHTQPTTSRQAPNQASYSPFSSTGRPNQARPYEQHTGPPPRRPPTCHFCHQEGHIQRYCPVKQGQSYQPMQHANHAPPVQPRMLHLRPPGLDGHTAAASPRRQREYAHPQSNARTPQGSKNGLTPPQKGGAIMIPAPFEKKTTRYPTLRNDIFRQK